MKKKILITIIAVLLLAVLFIPIPKGALRDGGTKEYSALTYKIVDWNRLTDDAAYDQTKVYFFPKNFKSIDSLWELEKDNATFKLNATVVELTKTHAVVEPFSQQEESNSSNKISFNIENLKIIDVKVGDSVKVTYKGGIMESYPAQINALDWELLTTLRDVSYSNKWIDKNDSTKLTDNTSRFSAVKITKIYSDCFFAKDADGRVEIKFNAKLSSEWCVGDEVYCTFENLYYDSTKFRAECDLLTIKERTVNNNPDRVYSGAKPVIYLYPENRTEVSVKLTLDGEFTCTYPEYKNGWEVTANVDGTITDKNGQSYNYLYWEALLNDKSDLSKGFCVKGEDTAKFLETATQKLGLTRKEANEFIVYWLPLMQDNKYNIITFQTDAYEDVAKLEITPSPDTLIRVFMVWQGVDEFVNLPEQTLSAPERQGFTAVEWGGAEIKE